MDSRTGQTFDTAGLALAAGVPIEHLVEISGTPEAIAHVSKAVAVAGASRKKARRAQRMARRRNR